MIRQKSGAAAAGMAEWLCLAAAPTFAVMALLTFVLEGSQPDAICSAQGLPLSGMALMYALMSAFHLAPWLKLLAGPGLVAQPSRRLPDERNESIPHARGVILVPGKLRAQHSLLVDGAPRDRDDEDRRDGKPEP